MRLGRTESERNSNRRLGCGVTSSLLVLLRFSWGAAATGRKQRRPPLTTLRRTAPTHVTARQVPRQAAPSAVSRPSSSLPMPLQLRIVKQLRLWWSQKPVEPAAFPHSVVYRGVMMVPIAQKGGMKRRGDQLPPVFILLRPPPPPPEPPSHRFSSTTYALATAKTADLFLWTRLGAKPVTITTLSFRHSST